MEKTYRKIGYVFIGFVFVGSVLSTIDITIKFFSITQTSIISLFIVLGYFLIELYVRFKGLSWKTDKGITTRITKLGVKSRLSILGLLIALWTPLIINLSNKQSLSQKEINLVRQAAQTIQECIIIQDDKCEYRIVNSLNVDYVELQRLAKIVENESNELLDKYDAALVLGNYQAAHKYAKASAEKGNPVAQAKLAVFYFNGRGVEQNDSTALHWAYKANERGVFEANRILSIMYRKGQGVEKDLQKAFNLTKQAADSKNHPTWAVYDLGYYYEYGKGTDVNCVLALKCYSLVAQHSKSDNWLGGNAALGASRIYWEGKGRVKQNDTLAFEWLTAAVYYKQPEAYYYLGLCYSFGKGVEKNSMYAFDNYYQGALLGEKNSQNALGVSLSHGYAGILDLESAKQWFEKSMDQGHKLAASNYETVIKRINDEFNGNPQIKYCCTNHSPTHCIISAEIENNLSCNFIWQNEKNAANNTYKQ